MLQKHSFLTNKDNNFCKICIIIICCYRVYYEIISSKLICNIPQVEFINEYDNYI